MTQIILHKTPKGIILATDSLAVMNVTDDSPQYRNVQKVFRLTPHVVLATGGAGYGILLCQAFRSHVMRSGLCRLDKILQLSVPFFRSEMQRLRREHPILTASPDLDRVYIVIAGYTPDSSEHPFQFVVLGSEHASDSLHIIQTGHMAAIPRNLKIEYYLTRPSALEMTLDELQIYFENFMVKLARSSEDVGPPFYFVHVTENGVDVRIRDATA